MDDVLVGEESRDIILVKTTSQVVEECPST